MNAIKGFLGVSLIDWPGRISSIIYLSGCNFKCHFCYNVDLVLNPKRLPSIDENLILEKLKERKNFIEGVVITGGEPTLYPHLEKLIQKINKIKLPVAIETNGSNPEILKKITKKRLLNGIFMDIKGPLEKYKEITNSNINTDLVKESAEFIKNLYPKIDAEFRMTVVPSLINKKDIEYIGKWLGPDCEVPFCLQQFQNHRTLNPEFEKIIPYASNDLQTMQKIAKKYFKKVKVRN